MDERRAFQFAGETEFAQARFFASTHPSTCYLSTVLSGCQDPFSPAFRVELLGFIVHLFSDWLKRGDLPSTRILTAQQRFVGAIAQMPDTALLDQTRETAAEICGCSPRHFSRLFSERYGKSLQEWQTDLRLLKAREMLLESDINIADTARTSGYNTVSLFNSMFKKRFGITPAALRRRLRFSDIEASVSTGHD